MIFDPFVLTFVLLFLAVVLPLAWGLCRGTTQRLLLISTLLGFTVFNGFAASTVEAPTYMTVGFFVFIVVLIAGFRLGAMMAYPIGNTLALHTAPVIAHYAEGRGARRMIMIYLALILITLVVPEFKLHRLLAPPSPDIRALFDARFTVQKGAIDALVGIFTALVTPMYYLGLYRYRRRIGRLVLLVLAPLYMAYVRDAYISRNEVLLALIYLYMMVWASRPRWRSTMVVAALVSLPVLGGLAHAYTFARLGVAADGSGALAGMLAILGDEATLPLKIGVPLVESGQTADLVGYFLWIFTLPIPGFLKSWLPIIYLNYDISEIVLGHARGTPQFYVVLPGLIGESMYLYGKVLFVLHPLMIGMIIGGFAGILQNIPRTQAVVFFLANLVSFNLNRGGIAAVMPVMVNDFLLFAAIVLITTLRQQRHRSLERARQGPAAFSPPTPRDTAFDERTRL